MLCVRTPAAAGPRADGQSENANQNWGTVVHDIINHEVDAQAHDNSLWCYRKQKVEDGKEEVFAACQAKGAEIDRLASVNGKMLSEEERKAEDERIEKLLKSKRELEKQARKQHEDAKQATDLLRLIPEAFLFELQTKDGDRIRLKFRPNQDFHPSGHEAMVFHHMEGTLTLDLKQKRLVEISGRLDSPVKFGGGLLGHLDQGGTFLVRQQEVATGCWEMAMLDVKMDGKVLFFKTIGVREREVDSEFKPVPPSATLQQAAELTKGKNTEVAARK